MAIRPRSADRCGWMAVRTPYVGVLPAGFYFRDDIDVYSPIGQVEDPQMQRRSDHPGIHAIARLRPGIALAAARAAMTVEARRLSVAYPDTNQGEGAFVRTLKDDIVAGSRPTLLMLLAAVAMVLLIACANVANLLLARSTVRQREIAIRAALGAGAGRVARQLLTESVLLGVAGGTAGLALAAVLSPLLVRALGDQVPHLGQGGLDGRMLAFTALLSIGTGLLFGVAPALRGPSRRRGARAPPRRPARGRRPLAPEGRPRGRRGGSRLAAAGGDRTDDPDAGAALGGAARIRSPRPGHDAGERLPSGRGAGRPARGLPGPRDAGPRPAGRVGCRSARTSCRSGAMIRRSGHWTGSTPPPAAGETDGDDLHDFADLPPDDGHPAVAGRFLSDSDTSDHPRVVVIDEDLAREDLPGGIPSDVI